MIKNAKHFNGQKGRDIMQITLFGVVWIVVLFWASVKGSTALTKCVFFSAIMQSSAVLFIGDSVISPLLLSCIVYIVHYAIVHARRVRLGIPIFFKFFLLYWVIQLFSSILASFLFRGQSYMVAVGHVTFSRYDGALHLASLFHLFIFAFTGLLMYHSIAFTDQDFHRFLTVCVWFVAAVGVWQMMTMYGLLPRITLLEQLVYSNSRSADNIIYLYNLKYGIHTVRFQSSFMEPSYCAGFLALAFFYYISQEHLEWIDRWTVLAILAMAVLSFSATAYVTIAFAGIMALFISNRRKIAFRIVRRGLILIGMALALILTAGLKDMFVEFILEKNISGSAYIRNLWNANSLKTFHETFGIGLGYASVRGSGLFYTLLSSAGILGFLGYLMFVLAISFGSKACHKSKRYAMIVLVVTFAQIVAIGIIDYSIFWACFMLYCASETLQSSSQPICNAV